MPHIIWTMVSYAILGMSRLYVKISAIIIGVLISVGSFVILNIAFSFVLI